MGGKARPNTASSSNASTLKTQRTSESVENYVQAIPHAIRRRDAQTLLQLFAEVTGEQPSMWGTRLVGYGSYSYQYESGCAGDWPRTGFSPGKAHSTIYIMPGFAGQEALLAKLGPHKHSVSCLYIPNLDKVDMGVLRTLIADSLAIMETRYPS